MFTKPKPISPSFRNALLSETKAHSPTGGSRSRDFAAIPRKRLRFKLESARGELVVPHGFNPPAESDCRSVLQMKVPLDIHTSLWALTDPSGSARVRRLLPQADARIGRIESWDLIKAQPGKIALPRPTGSYVMSKLGPNRVRILDAKPHHRRRIELLPDQHREPLRADAACARLRGELSIVSGRSHFRAVIRIAGMW